MNAENQRGEPVFVFVRRNEKQSAPLTVDQINAQIMCGELFHEKTPAWIKGWESWRFLSDVPGIIFIPTPPIYNPPIANFTSIPRASLVALDPLLTPKITTELRQPPIKTVGLLQLHCVVLVIIIPIVSFLLMGGLSPLLTLDLDGPRLRILAYTLVFKRCIAFLMIVYGMIIGIRIWAGSKEGRQGRRLAQQYHIVRLCVFLVLEFTVYAILHDLPFFGANFVKRAMVIACLREGAIFLIYWSFFTDSKKVKAIDAALH